VALLVRLAEPADFPALFALRHAVFVLGQCVPVELERDGLDADADHAVALLEGRVVGTGRLLDGHTEAAGGLVPGTAGTVGTIGRMAVAAPARGGGIGRAVLDLLLTRAVERGLPVVELHAQLHARGFYERAGFSAHGDVYQEAGIEHIGMRRALVS
jgi:predicted GNAT family N-acyltransferase